MFTHDRSKPLPYTWNVTDHDTYSGTHEGMYIYVDPELMYSNIHTKGYIQPDLDQTGIKPNGGSNVYCNYGVPKQITNNPQKPYYPFTKKVSFTDITDIAYCTSPRWDEFAKERKYTYRDTPTVVGGK